MRRRWIAAAAAAVAVLALAAAALVYVPDGSRGVLEGRDGSLRILLRPGLYLRRPLFAPLSTYPAEPLRLEGRMGVVSREGSAIDLRYALAARLMDGGLEALHRARAGRLLEPFLRQAVEDTARHEAAAQPLPALLSPGARRALREALEKALEPIGIWLEPEGWLAWTLPEPPVNEAERAALHARVRSTGVKVLLVGLDGADWDLVDPLIQAGRLPVLAGLKRGGAWGTVRSEMPMLSPLLWTTIATGRPPEVHGVMDFLMRDPDSGRVVPISSSFRRVKALWNIVSDFGVGCDFVAWWATWPAERIDGTMVSDRLSYSLFSFVEQQAAPFGTTYPEEYLQEIHPRLISDRDIAYREVRRFVDIGEAEFRAARDWAARDPAAAYTDPVNHLTRILAATRNYHIIALDLLTRGQPPLAAVYYQGIDEVNHRFAHFAPPRMDRISAEEFRRYSGALEHFYEYQDELLGELVSRVDASTVVIVLSDHGFANGGERPRDFTPSIEGRPARWHTPAGIRILKGPVVKPGGAGEGRLYDVVPTVLRLLGVPLARDLEGKVWESALDAEFLKRFPSDSVDSYETLGRPLSVTASTGDRAGDAEFAAALHALGYIGGEEAAAVGAPAPAPGLASPASGSPAGAAPAGATPSYHSNLASILLHKGDVEGAEREFKAALAQVPHFGPALGGLAEVQQRRGRNEEALKLILEGLDSSPDPDDGLFAGAARLYMKVKRPAEGAERLAAAARRFPRRAAPRVCQGILLLRAGQQAQAEQVLREALQVDPGSVIALQELFELYREQGKLPDLERALLDALERTPRSVPLRNWLAWVRAARGDPAGAERYFRDALQEEPDHQETLANLGSLLIDNDRAAEAVEVLQRAVGREPRHWQSRVNLIIAFGRAGRIEDARKTYDGAQDKERGKPELLNALAYAYYLNGEVEHARETVKRSLAIDPDQPEAQRLLDTVGGG